MMLSTFFSHLGPGKPSVSAVEENILSASELLVESRSQLDEWGTFCLYPDAPQGLDAAP